MFWFLFRFNKMDQILKKFNNSDNRIEVLCYANVYVAMTYRYISHLQQKYYKTKNNNWNA